eukprot:CAMPEP_0198501218 /NCGR_PEP_ID=MMETSP1462-20131121/8586_1 /TAXON_ID=1333877 /ORGANISM="Brandtodinium nutriculum, Strain RCC3387" /LENGTH=353 /DNA_ID=CAMNT_0044230249 /DNA_START=82 /DNA_END=1143 /DNA_ORIENTATION=-
MQWALSLPMVCLAFVSAAAQGAVPEGACAQGGQCSEEKDETLLLQLPASHSEEKDSPVFADGRLSGLKTFSLNSTSDGVLRVTFNQTPTNLINTLFVEEMNKLCGELEQEPSTKVVIFQSANEAIWLGHYDANHFTVQLAATGLPRKENPLVDMTALGVRLTKLPQVTMAKIAGACRAGGQELALAMDMRYAAKGKAVFKQPEVAMGINPGAGGVTRLVRVVGLAKALEIILTADDYSAEQAEAIGTVNKALDADEIDAYVEKLAGRIAQWPAASINAAKQATYESGDTTVMNSLKNEEFWMWKAITQGPAVHRMEYLAKHVQTSAEGESDWEKVLKHAQTLNAPFWEKQSEE